MTRPLIVALLLLTSCATTDERAAWSPQMLAEYDQCEDWAVSQDWTKTTHGGAPWHQRTVGYRHYLVQCLREHGWRVP